MARLKESANAPVDEVTVVGAGSWGTVIASLLSQSARTTLWARSAEVSEELYAKRTNSAYLPGFRIDDALEVTADLEQALRSASLVVIAVPSQGLRGVLLSVVDRLPQSVPVLSLSKGLEEGSHLRMSEVIEQCWPGHPVGVLTGPNLAVEVAAGQPTASVVAFSDEQVAARIQDVLSSAILRVYTNPDVIGCEISGVVKNVLAIASGMATGLGFGDNTRAALITRALAELTRFGVALGGHRSSFSGLAGLGDLVATCTSDKSRNFSFGLALGRGATPSEVLSSTRTVAEGFASCRPVVALSKELGVEMPLCEQVVAVCHEGRSPAEAIPMLMGRAARSEFDAV